MWEGLYLVYYGSYNISCLKSEIVDPKSKMASIGTLLMVTNKVEQSVVLQQLLLHLFGLTIRMPGGPCWHSLKFP